MALDALTASVLHASSLRVSKPAPPLYCTLLYPEHQKPSSFFFFFPPPPLSCRVAIRSLAIFSCSSSQLGHHHQHGKKNRFFSPCICVFSPATCPEVAHRAAIIYV